MTARRAALQSGQLGPRSYTIAGDGFRSVHPLVEGFYRWKAVTGVGETLDYLFVQTGPMAAFVIPKRAFPSAAEASTFGARIREQLAR